MIYYEKLRAFSKSLSIYKLKNILCQKVGKALGVELKKAEQISALMQVMSWPVFLQRLLTPAIDQIADMSQLSTIQVQQTLPTLLNALSYQLLQRIHQHQMTTHKTAAASLQQLLNQSELHKLSSGSAANLTTMHPQVEQNRQYLFDDPTSWYMLLGALAAKTQLTVSQITQLFPFVITLSMSDLARFINVDANQHPSIDLERWIKEQPLFLANPDNQVFADICGFQSTYNSNENAKLAQVTSQYSAYQPLVASLESFIATQPFASTRKSSIVTDSAEKVATSISVTKSPLPSDLSNSSDDIFTKASPQKASWLSRLQQYWIATAALLSILVFGSLAWAFNDRMQLSMFAKPTAPVIEKKPTYNDVAIVRVASTSANIAESAIHTAPQLAKDLSSADKTSNSTTNASKKSMVDGKASNKTVAQDELRANSKAKSKSSDKDKNNADGKDKTDAKKLDLTKPDIKKPNTKKPASEKAASEKTETKQSSNKRTATQKTSDDANAKNRENPVKKSATDSAKTRGKQQTSKKDEDKTKSSSKTNKQSAKLKEDKALTKSSTNKSAKSKATDSKISAKIK